MPLIALLPYWLLVACFADGACAADSPVQADYLGSRDGKPPLKFHSVRLTLMNQQDKPVWLVLPYWGDKPLPEKGVFPNKNWKDQPFGGKKFDGVGGSAVEVLMYGGDGFKAFRLPAKGKLELDGYTIEADRDIAPIVVIEAQELKVNGKTPLEKWLPYATTSGEKVKVGEHELNTDWKNLDWDPKRFRSRDDYPKEKVEEVKAEGIRCWTVKFQQKAEKKAP
ncbi:MAG TPA: hypothetical protein VKS79_00960 [Gemmataceae bacterium]|nr:hypothetical protein [Gemmataceae bacterium]